MYDMYDRQFEQNGSNVYLFDDEATAFDAMMDLTSRGIEVENIEDFDEKQLTENQPTAFDDESMDALRDIILKYVEDPDAAERLVQQVDDRGLDSLPSDIEAQLERDPEFKAWYHKLHHGSDADTDYMKRRREEDDYYDADQAQKDDEEEYERGYDDDGLPLGEDALGFSDIEKFGSKAASDIDISVRRDPNYTFGKRPGDDDQIKIQIC